MNRKQRRQTLRVSKHEIAEMAYQVMLLQSEPVNKEHEELRNSEVYKQHVIRKTLGRN